MVGRGRTPLLVVVVTLIAGVALVTIAVEAVDGTAVVEEPFEEVVEEVVIRIVIVIEVVTFTEEKWRMVGLEGGPLKEDAGAL
ncbi:MAG: hypothetical protein M1835_002839 [Candelina submexicana]|nr:MAG: hypothetical protein M1835_002839 [Candelina submexicana]